ncbi:MAG: hypothetical protein ACJAUP_003553 [Cellvibrionaceae bacterium]|jgi:hypothetical protein
MKVDQEEITGALYSEFYEISQKATRESLKEYNLSDINRDDLILETKKNKKSLVYKLFATHGFSKTLIATTKVSTITKAASVKVTNLEKND